MAFFFPFSTLHELNLDWIMDRVKTLWEQADDNNNKANYAVETADEAKEIAEQAAQAQIGDGAVTTTKLADGAVTTIKLADDAVTSAKIKDGEVKNSDLATDAVTTAKIMNSSVTRTKIMDGEVVTDKLATAAVTNGKIADGAVNTVKLADNSVTSPKLDSSMRDQIGNPVTVATGTHAATDITYNIIANNACCTVSLVRETTGTAGSGWTTIYTLADEYKPLKIMFAYFCDASGNPLRMRIGTDGTCALYSPPTGQLAGAITFPI